MIKRYMQDADEVEESARLVARIEDARTALGELALLYGRCGVLAAEYADPDWAALTLVKDVTDAYREERWLIRHHTTAALAA
ncbi:hypothetical protein ACFV1L_05995 [Kitasatospora sp. NPDC059646]|uniref:hypothetical protein n=1 Tax=Kitasatospora sp. NPDC059646 TaxID=3346893 RepID=UPI0036BCE1B8